MTLQKTLFEKPTWMGFRDPTSRTSWPKRGDEIAETYYRRLEAMRTIYLIYSGDIDILEGRF